VAVGKAASASARRRSARRGQLKIYRSTTKQLNSQDTRAGVKLR
jgi:hypothetical protein